MSSKRWMREEKAMEYSYDNERIMLIHSGSRSDSCAVVNCNLHVKEKFK